MPCTPFKVAKQVKTIWRKKAQKIFSLFEHALPLQARWTTSLSRLVNILYSSSHENAPPPLSTASTGQETFRSLCTPEHSLGQETF